MKSTKLVYIVLLCELMILNIIFVRYWPVWLLLLVLSCGIALMIKVKIQGRYVRLVKLSQDKLGEEGNDSNITIRMYNDSVLPIASARLILSYKEPYVSTFEKNKYLFCVPAKGYSDIIVDVDASHVGVGKVSLNDLRIYDDILLNKCKIKSKGIESSFYVLPKYYPNAGLPVEITDRDIIDSDIFSKTQKGDDPSEVFEIREYQPGDRINRIHWKLSAKATGTFVKDFSKPVSDRDVIVFENGVYSPSENDLIYEGLISLMYSLLEQGRSFDVLYMDEEIKSYGVESYADVKECLKTIIGAKQCEESAVAKKLMMIDTTYEKDVYVLAKQVSEEEIRLLEEIDKIAVALFTIEDGSGISLREWILNE